MSNLQKEKEDKIRQEIVRYVNRITGERELKYILAVVKKTKQIILDKSLEQEVKEVKEFLSILNQSEKKELLSILKELKNPDKSRV